MAGSKQERERRRRAREYEARKAVHELQVERRGRDNRLSLIALAVVAVLAAGLQVLFLTVGPGSTPAAEPVDTTLVDPLATEGAATAVPAPTPTSTGTVPSAELSEHRTWTGTMTINGIPLGVELDGAAAPQGVANMVTLAQDAYYDGTPCHRLVTAGIYVLQCGDPTGAGTGGPGYSWGPIENAPAADLYPEGTIAMARRGGDGASMGSQFFIVTADSTIPSDMAGGYTVLGRVTSGLEELKAAVVAQGVAGGSTDGAPAVPTTLESFVVQ